jgi:putative dimethyl sulfoxide reductase chaperone
MPIPSEQSSAVRSQRSEWAAKTDAPKRSVFGNYRADDSCSSGRESPPVDQSRLTSAATSDTRTPQSAIDLAVARSIIHRFLAKAYEDPTPEGWAWLCDAATQESVRSAVRAVAAPRQSAANCSDILSYSLRSFLTALRRGSETIFLDAYLATFGHAARGSCPLNEIEYGDIKADPLFQPHRLADLAAFYRAFGLEIAEDAGERQDHICLELEFMCVLAAKEAYALEHQFNADRRALCRDAQKKFLREHLGRWTPAFCRRLVASTAEPTLRALANFTGAFIESECALFGVSVGSQDLLLRPMDETADRMCDSCGIHNLPPGALAPE